MSGWFEDQVIEPGRLPLFLCLLAFVVTFLVTRTITRTIRLGRGPFHDNVSDSGVHVHHAVPGIVVLITGAFVAVASGQTDGWAEVAGVLVGIGTSLVLDEFALILRLDDVYWSEEGRISIAMVSLAAAVLGLMVLGFNPFRLSEEDGADLVALVVSVVVIALHLVLVLVLVAKGRYALALLGAVIPLVAIAFVAQMAQPQSRWARRRYDDDKLERARDRAQRRDQRYGRHARSLSNFVAGAPTSVETALQPPPPGSGGGDPS